MRLSELRTKTRSQEIEPEGLSIETIRPWIRTIQATPQPVVFRGLPRSQFHLLLTVDPSQQERRSANTSNEYTWLMSTLANWQEYPKRSRSIVCTTAKSKALQYGTIYVVLTDIEAKFGVCPTRDIWESFPAMKRIGIGDLHTFNKLLGIPLLTNFKYRDTTKSYDTFIEALRKLNDLFTQAKNESKELPFYIYELYYYEGGKLSFVEWIASILSPERNGFSTMTYRELRARRPGSREVWTDASTLLVNADYYNQFRSDVLKAIKPS